MKSNKYRSIILPQAEKDIDETLNYIINNLDNPIAAKKLLDEIYNAVERISFLPYSMPIIQNINISLNDEYHWISVKNFLLIYKIKDDLKEIRIMAFLYGKSNIISKITKII